MAEQGSDIETSGTISPVEPFDKDADKKALFDAIKGLGTKEKVITEILTKRTNSQRQDIMEAYLLAYDKDLVDVMKSELSGDYLSVVEGLLDEPAVFLAKAIHKYATDTSMLPTSDLGLCLLEIIFPLNYLETSYIKEVYQQVFGTVLDEDIALNVFGPWKTVLMNVEKGHRHDTACIDTYKVDQDTEYLLQVRTNERRGRQQHEVVDALYIYILRSLTPVDDWALPNARIEDLLIQDSLQHLQKVFKKVKQSMSMKGVDVIDAIKESNMITEQKDGFLAVVSVCLDYVRFNATVLHKAMSGIGTDDDTLIRVIVSRCEIDLKNIQSEFEEMYGKSLREWVTSDTSGDYRDILLAIIGD